VKPQRQLSFTEKLFLAGWLVLYAFSLGLTVIVLTMGIGGRLKGSTSSKALFLVFLILWLVVMHAVATARVKSRYVKCDESPFDTLRSERPSDPNELAVWRWTRIAAGAALGWLAVLTILWVGSRLGFVSP
jgi:hypothetical protein